MLIRDVASCFSFIFQNHVLHPIIKIFDPYIKGVQFVVFPA